MLTEYDKAEADYYRGEIDALEFLSIADKLPQEEESDSGRSRSLTLPRALRLLSTVLQHQREGTMVARTNILQQCGFNNANIRDYRKTSEKPTAEPLTKALVATWDAETARMSNDFVTGALKEAQPRDKLKFVQGADPNNYSEARIRKPTQVNVGDTSGTAMMNVLQLLSGKKDSPIDVTPDRHKLEAMPLTIDGGCDGQDDE